MFMSYIGEKLIRNLSFVEMMDIEQIAVKNYLISPSKVKSHNASKFRGLSRLSETMLGQPLSKVETQTNWMHRPLRSCQIEYAALDAFVLIKLYIEFEPQLEEIYQLLHARNKNAAQQKEKQKLERELLTTDISVDDDSFPELLECLKIFFVDKKCIKNIFISSKEQ